MTVHDATRLAWNVTIARPAEHRALYDFEVELEVPTTLVGVVDLSSALETTSCPSESASVAEGARSAFHGR